MDIIQISIKLTVGFVGLWVITRLLGKKEISQLTPFDFVSSLMLGEIVGNTIYSEDVRFVHLIYSLVFWMLLSYTLEKLTFKSKMLRKPLDGAASVLIENGILDVKELDRNKLDFEQLQMMLRQKDIFSMKEVAYAVFETNGSLSVLKRSAYQTINRIDLDLPKQEVQLAISLVEKGEIQHGALQSIRKNYQWLMEELRSQGYEGLDQVAYAEWTEGEGLYIVKKA